ncbi:hypothetical protein APR04_003376 [Promicromonospora umidemergens]|nr:hypothetical protein [Promicromonospora umidemergens]
MELHACRLESSSGNVLSPTDSTGNSRVLPQVVAHVSLRAPAFHIPGHRRTAARAGIGVGRSTGRPVRRWLMGRWIGGSVDRWIGGSTGRPAGRQVGKSASRQVGKSASRQVCPVSQSGQSVRSVRSISPADQSGRSVRSISPADQRAATRQIPSRTLLVLVAEPQVDAGSVAPSRKLVVLQRPDERRAASSPSSSTPNRTKMVHPGPDRHVARGSARPVTSKLRFGDIPAA